MSWKKKKRKTFKKTKTNERNGMFCFVITPSWVDVNSSFVLFPVIWKKKRNRRLSYVNCIHIRIGVYPLPILIYPHITLCVGTQQMNNNNTKINFALQVVCLFVVFSGRFSIFATISTARWQEEQQNLFFFSFSSSFFFRESRPIAKMRAVKIPK